MTVCAVSMEEEIDIEMLRLIDNLSEEESILNLLAKNAKCFGGVKLSTTVPENHPFVHNIETRNSWPISVCPRRRSPEERTIIRYDVAKMLELGVIERANGPWSSPIVLVRKKDGTVRFCVDYRKRLDCQGHLPASKD